MRIVKSAEERKNEIKGKVRSLQWKSLAKIAEENNIYYAEASLSEIAEWVSWFILYDHTKDRFWMLIEKSDHPNRKRFTFAHELWHFFLHADKLKWDHSIFIDTEYTNTLFRGPKINIKEEDKPLEAEANLFAAELLMPENVVKKAYNEIWSIEILSDIFKVSVEAMKNRLSNLNLLKSTDEK
jgi:Zn-dependent peptidase ImmA (M78 family)